MNVDRLFSLILSVVILLATESAGFAQQTVGPTTEKRFPPLVIPAGFTATLFACDPLVEYPSVISIGPRQGTLFVAHDYVTGLGVEIVRRDEVRLLEDTDRDGYADQSTVYAEGFNSIQGLAYADGSIYVMHAPFLTRLRDTNGDGRADERRDLIKGLGLPPEENSNRLHCANGVAVGYDGWLYLALGDRGCDVQRPEGDRLLFQKGGILRCRTDGSDLHVFSSGLRNIYDVVLDNELNVFVRDNENDGGDYMIRVYYCFYGSDQGYPYHYYERPDEALPPLADLGRGSSAGGVCYTGTSFPREYQGNLFFCEWGRAVVRYPRERSGSGFAATQEFDFAAAADNDPYGLKPTDLVVDHDGSLLISDWGDGQRPKRGRGRIYRVQAQSPDTASGAGNKVDERLLAVWRLAQQEDAVPKLLALASHDENASVRVQAIRAIADRTDPILVQHKLAAGRGDQQLAAELARLADHERSGAVKREVLIALRRLQWQDAPTWLASTKRLAEPAFNHAAMQLLRHCGNWPGVLALLDVPPPNDLRSIALRALAEQPEAIIVDGVIERLRNEATAARRRELADVLTRVNRQPGPWTYWGFRAGPRPANPQIWNKTQAIERMLDLTLRDKDEAVRVFTLARMQREAIPVRLETLAKWLREDTQAPHIVAIIAALRTRPADEVRPLLREVVANNRQADAGRIAALQLFVSGLDAGSESMLKDLATQLQDGAVLAAIVTELGHRPKIKADAWLLKKLASPQPAMRAAAIRALSDRQSQAAAQQVARLLSDVDLRVQTQAVVAAGVFQAAGVNDRVLELAARADDDLQHACLVTLKQLDDARAVDMAVAALKRPATQLAALRYLQEFGGPGQVEAVTATAAQSLDADIHQAAIVALSQWVDHAAPEMAATLRTNIAQLQMATGAVRRWETASTTYFATGVDAQVRGLVMEAKASGWRATSQVYVDQATDVEFLASSNGTLQVVLNGKLVFDRQKKAAYRPDSDRFAAQLAPGLNELAVRITGSGDAPRFHLRFRTRSSKAEHERLMELVLAGGGNAERGRELFHQAEKSLCLKCHRLGNEGGKIGPDLAGIGSRFSRIHILESILEPSRTIAPSYGTLAVALANGQVLSGVVIAEDNETLTLGDTQGKTQGIRKADIEERLLQPKSTMPEGLEQKFSDREFLDLVAYLTSLTKRPK